MKTISIAVKDLKILFKDRGTLFQLFLLPLLFIIVFSGALGAISEGQVVTLPAVALVDLDGGPMAQGIIKDLTAGGDFNLQTYPQAEALTLLDANKVIGLLTIPSGFTDRVQQSQPTTLSLSISTKADPQQVEALRLVLVSVAANMTLESQIVVSLTQMGEMQASAPAEYQVFDTERVLAQAHAQFENAQVRPLIKVVQSTPQQPTEQASTTDLSQSAVPGFTVLFVFLTAQTTAQSIFEEKKIGSFRRLVAAPISKAELLIGKILPNFITALLQIVVIFAFGSLGMRLMGLTPLPIEKAPLGVAVIAVVLALCSCAFGIAIASIARTENQIAGLSTLLLWGMGLLGGSLVPLFILDRFLGPIPMVVPHYWANRAFADLLIRGLGTASVTVDVAVLFGFSILFFAIGLWRFDFER
ncbi:MAG TPA: ABC transporter permease [Anaerolineales bacterium]|nr:ABC transporter permease [Anaerolineales bacterium]